MNNWLNSTRRLVLVFIGVPILVVLTFVFFFVLPYGDCLMLGGCEQAAQYHYPRGISRYEGALSSGSHDFFRARVEFDMAIRAKPDFAEAYSYRALVHAAEGSYDAAIADCNKAKELNPNSPLVTKNCAEIHDPGSNK